METPVKERLGKGKKLLLTPRLEEPWSMTTTSAACPKAY